MTQHPLDSTVSDFWNMIWDQNSIGIVLLSAVDDTVSAVAFRSESHSRVWSAQSVSILFRRFVLM